MNSARVGLPFVLLLAVLLLGSGAPATAGERGAAELRQALLDLSSELRAAVVAARPDDIPWAAAAYLRRKLGFRTTVFLLSDGDFGESSGPALSLAVESVGASLVRLGFPPGDYSRTLEEALADFDRDEALLGLIEAVRRVRPHLVLVGGGGEPGDHRHLAAAKLAREAFDAAADTSRYAEQGPAWSVTKLYLTTGEGPEVRLPLDELDPFRGVTFAEMGVSARGIAGLRRSDPEPTDFFLAADRAEDGANSLLAGLPVPRPEWLEPDSVRVPRRALVRRLVSLLDTVSPERFGRAMAAALGVEVELTRTGPEPVRGEATEVTARLRNRSLTSLRVGAPVVLTGRNLEAEGPTVIPGPLPPGRGAELRIPVQSVDEAEEMGATALADPDGLQVTFPIRLGEEGPEFPVRKRISLRSLPRFEWALRPYDRLILPVEGTEWVHLTLKNRGSHGISGEPVVEFEGSDRLRAEYPEQVTVPARGQTVVRIVVHVQDGVEEGPVTIRVRYRNTVLEDRLQVVEFGVPGHLRIGVVETPEDQTFPALLAMGVRPERMTDDEIIYEDLARYDTIVLGVHALSARRAVARAMPRLLDYVKDRGNLVVLQCLPEHWSPRYSPYDLGIGTDRVTRENARIYLSEGEHSLLTSPNRISVEDFDGWAVDRGMGFPNRWDEDGFEVVLETADPGQPRLPGVLTCRYGTGTYSFTCLSWHHQLPRLNPAALKMLGNLVALPFIR